MTDKEVCDILKKYDPQFYNYYMNNAWFFSSLSLRGYAEYLLKKNGGK